MGQLERYGLYVLCLVIFLILGVAIWGGDPPPATAGGENLTAELERLSTPVPETRAPEPVSADNPYLGEFLDLNNAPPRPQESAASPARLANEEASPPPATTPTPAAARAETPPATEVSYYVVKQGDILEEISKRELGKRSRWREIEALNPGVEEKNLKVGDRLRMPPRVSGSPQREWFYYVVKKDDNYSTISARLYGTQKYWKQIADLNPAQDPKRLRPGTQIRVPFINN